MPDDRALSAARTQALFYELGLDAKQRKELGQFFTGLPLARVLAALSVRRDCSAVIDPMAGHGDLLDAALERCARQGIRPRRVDAIEVETRTADECRKRLRPWSAASGEDTLLTVHARSAFDPDLICTFPPEGYDLVITNPPYVRYQTVAGNGRDESRGSAEGIRSALLRIMTERSPRLEQEVWRALVRGYSGLADLSVPAWLLAAVLVRPGGVLALVAPATWRSRDYADVLRYLLARCFQIEVVVADRQPGWFPNALVRTHLVVATRLPTQTVHAPLALRPPTGHDVTWAEVDPTVSSGESLVRGAFDGDDPEGQFAKWVLSGNNRPAARDEGHITASQCAEGEIVGGFRARRTTSWLKRLEPTNEELPLFGIVPSPRGPAVPRPLRTILPSGFSPDLVTLAEAGLQVSQGLRTGCNRFFYVDLVEDVDRQTVRIRVDGLLGGSCVVVPRGVLKPVLRRQSDLRDFAAGSALSSHVLDLRGYVLPNDVPRTEEARDLYEMAGMEMPKPMPEALAELVHRAASASYGSERTRKLIPELSAVQTNVRPARYGSRPAPPRFWYMLPDFMRRHLPDALVPRVNQGTPLAITNRNPPVLIDANFSTIWSDTGVWTGDCIAGVMNCAWSRASMEAIGTPMGGGALKLEATQLRRLPMPKLASSDIRWIAQLTGEGGQGSMAPQTEIDRITVTAVLPTDGCSSQVDHVIAELYRVIEEMRRARQRR